MDWLFSKLGELRSGGLEAFFLFISSFSFIDYFSIVIWKTNMTEKFSKLTILEITYLILAYFCVFYFLKLFRFLITNLFISKISSHKIDNEYYKEYYYLYELLEDSIRENNKVKYKNYLRIKAQNETQNNLKTLSFVTVVIIVLDCLCCGTTLNTLLNCKIFQIIFIFFGLGFLLWGLQVNSDDDTNTLIRKDEFKF